MTAAGPPAPATLGVSAAQAQALDGAAAAAGVPPALLMTLAGFQLARLAWRRTRGAGPIVVLAGGGNNGGDGLAAARHLAAWGVEVRAVLVADRAGLREPAAAELDRAQRCGVAVGDGDGDGALGPALAGARLILDGLLGTGLRDAPRPRQAAAIRATAAAGPVPVLSIDVPSGLDGTTGRVHDPCVRAADTAMLGIPKHGCLVAPRAVVGRLWVVDIGIPPGAYRSIGAEGPGPAGGDWQRLRPTGRQGPGGATRCAR